MTNNEEIKVVGSPCGQHGAYTFYKAFMYSKNGVKRIVTLSEFFFVKLWIDSDLLCIGELQLLWNDKNSDQVLASLRLYFLPENTPEGRMDHGEDEVLAISEKVVLRLDDLYTWITVDAEWTWGRLATCEKEVDLMGLEKDPFKYSNVQSPHVIILSYQRYCRYRSIMKRLEGVENQYANCKIVKALGGFLVPYGNTRILFCRDTFDYPELEGHEMLCNHLAPKLKGRPRGKRKKRCISPGSESNESESSASNLFTTSMKKSIEEISSTSRGSIRCDTLRRSTRSSDQSASKEFLKTLTIFMKTKYTPLGRIPTLGQKELDLYSFFTKVQKLGGYDGVTTNRLWRSVFDELVGRQNISTNGATIIKRHYERFLLPYERHTKGQKLIKSPRRLDSNSKTENTTSDSESSIIVETTLRSCSSTPIPTLIPIDDKEEHPATSKNIETQSMKQDVIDENKHLMDQIKSRKLDILKEGGLEVTPIKPKSVTKSNCNNTNRLTMIHEQQPASVSVIPSCKRIVLTQPRVFKESRHTNEYSLPNVVQSKSIYTYSEKTTYNNPKDFLAATKSSKTNLYHDQSTAGEILDLSVKNSVEKPIVEIVKLPPAVSILNGRRLGSNLEITLVPPEDNRCTTKRSYNQSTHLMSKVPRFNQSSHMMHPPLNIPQTTTYHHRKSSSTKSTVPIIQRPDLLQPPPAAAAAAASFNYLANLYENCRKSSPATTPPYLPLIDSLYYTAAMQRFYNGTNTTTSSTPNIPYTNNSEQLKLYTDLMVHNSRLNYSGLRPGSNSNSLHKP